MRQAYIGTDDADAAVYIAAVEAADGQALETATRVAIHSFVKGCKADGIWTAIKASCILAGARTLAGALVPLVGTAPTNVNFVSGDYNRKTGLVGDGSTKNLQANRNNTSDPQNNRHMSVYVTTVDNRAVTRTYIGVGFGNGWTSIIDNQVGTMQVWCSSIVSNTTRVSNSAGLIGASRNIYESFTARSGGSDTTVLHGSQAPQSSAFGVFSNGSLQERTTARIAFYSIGESLNLALLDTRVTNLINAFATAIP